MFLDGNNFYFHYWFPEHYIYIYLVKRILLYKSEAGHLLSELKDKTDDIWLLEEIDCEVQFMKNEGRR